MTPSSAYRHLNNRLWEGRLPKAFVTFLDDDTMPDNYGITVWDEDFRLPLIFINASRKRWLKVLIHECLHVAEPTLSHGRIFDALVEAYWRKVKKELRGLK